MTKKVSLLQLHIKPVAGKHVIDPVTALPLPPEGKLVTSSIYWRRRLRDGDVEKFNPKDTKKSKKKEA